MATAGVRRLVRGYRDACAEWAREVVAVECGGAMPAEEWPRRWRADRAGADGPRR